MIKAQPACRRAANRLAVGAAPPGPVASTPQLPCRRRVLPPSYPLCPWHGWGLEVGNSLHLLPPAGQFMVGVPICIAIASGSYFLSGKPFLTLTIPPLAPALSPPALPFLTPTTTHHPTPTP